LNAYAKQSPLASGLPALVTTTPFLSFTRTATKAEVVDWPPTAKPFAPDSSSPSSPRSSAVVLIYVVDDEVCLTELYSLFLKGTEYEVRAFNSRAAALAALVTERRKPDLLITDHSGLSTSVERFLQQCLGVHPDLRILMASGFRHSDLQLSQWRPDRFIQKPFAADEFLREVRATLAA
jgi:response regulator RpfG family c-di-GMP phosphodiesterase